MDEQFSPNDNAGPRAGAGPVVDPQQLAQLLMAARAAQRGSRVATLAQSAALPQSSPRAFVLAPTDPFAAEAGASRVSTPGPQTSAAPETFDPAKAAAIQSAREAQANPQVSRGPGQTAKGKPAADPFPKVETPSAEDIANGNYIKVGFRHLLRHDPSKLGLHTYADIPVMENGKAKLDENGKPMFESYGVLGNPTSTKGEHQQVRKNDRDPRWQNADRNSQVPGYEGKEVFVKVTPEQRETLRQGMQYFTEEDENGNFKNPCPVCGDRYHLLGPNSNEFIYNMLFWNPAGPIPAPKPASNLFTPAYYQNDPNVDWYPKTSH